MHTSTLLRTLFSYHACANGELLNKMEGFHPENHKEERHTALRLINHTHVVNQIFAAHLVGKQHAFSADNTPQTPPLADLRVAVAAIDRWYLEYVETVTPESLSQSVSLVLPTATKDACRVKKCSPTSSRMPATTVVKWGKS